MNEKEAAQFTFDLMLVAGNLDGASERHEAFVQLHADFLDRFGHDVRRG